MAFAGERGRFPEPIEDMCAEICITRCPGPPNNRLQQTGPRAAADTWRSPFPDIAEPELMPHGGTHEDDFHYQLQGWCW